MRYSVGLENAAAGRAGVMFCSEWELNPWMKSAKENWNDSGLPKKWLRLCEDDHCGRLQAAYCAGWKYFTGWAVFM